MPEESPAGGSGGSPLSVFPDLFGQIDVQSVLGLGNGLAFLALLLAAILITIQMIRGNTGPAAARSITIFCSVAAFFVVATIAVDVLRLVMQNDERIAEVKLKVSPVSLQDIGERFPLHIVYQGAEFDLFTSPFETSISNPEVYLYVNANGVAGLLERKNRQITEFARNLETRPALVATSPGSETPQLPASIERGG
jgi:hypothetical protein